MKSSLVSRNDPFMSDHQSLMAVDPSFSHDFGSFSKGTKAVDDAHDTVCPFCSYLRSFELTEVLLDESQVFSTYPTWMELANMDDSQLENLILGGDSFVDTTGSATAEANIGTSLALTPKHSPEHDFEEFLNTLEFTDELLNQPSAFTFDFEASVSNSNSAVDLTPPLTPVHQSIQDPLSACIFESGIANFEEVSSSLLEQQEQHLTLLESVGFKSDWSSQVSSPAITEAGTEIEGTFQVDEDNGDTESVQSFGTTTTTTSRASTLKRKLVTVDEEVEDDDEEYLPPSKKANKAPAKRAARKTPARRNRRVQDERVKNQNKVAAMKYRAKKRDEKSTMDVLYDIENEKNKKLKSQVEELQVNIDVLKELLGKYLKKE